MKSYAFLPLIFVKFWYIDSPVGMIKYFLSLNNAFFQLFSLPLLWKTFFKPLKNEYRQGLVRFSRFMGVLIKSVLIFVDVLLLILLISFELLIFISFLTFPILTVLLILWQ
jgi:hypothetical protein